MIISHYLLPVIFHSSKINQRCYPTLAEKWRRKIVIAIKVILISSQATLPIKINCAFLSKMPSKIPTYLFLLSRSKPIVLESLWGLWASEIQTSWQRSRKKNKRWLYAKKLIIFKLLKLSEKFISLTIERNKIKILKLGSLESRWEKNHQTSRHKLVRN